jgi:hypothetical protein
MALSCVRIRDRRHLYLDDQNISLSRNPTRVFCRNDEICRRVLPLDGGLFLSERTPSLATAPLPPSYGASLVDACYMAACTYEAK